LLTAGDAKLQHDIGPSPGESGLIELWSKHLTAAVDFTSHLPPQVAIGSGGC